MNLCVTGTRNRRADVEEALAAYAAVFGAPSLIVLGGDVQWGGKRSRRGVDLQAYEYAREHGWRGVTCFAQWPQLGKRAGPERNGRMVRLAGQGAVLLAFPCARSTGTWDCVRQARAVGLHCVVVDRDPVVAKRSMLALIEQVWPAP